MASHGTRPVSQLRRPSVFIAISCSHMTCSSSDNDRVAQVDHHYTRPTRCRGDRAVPTPKSPGSRHSRRAQRNNEFVTIIPAQSIVQLEIELLSYCPASGLSRTNRASSDRPTLVLAGAFVTRSVAVAFAPGRGMLLREAPTAADPAEESKQNGSVRCGVPPLAETKASDPFA